MENVQRKVQEAVKELVDDLDRSLLRKKQADMHRCAAKCCDDTITTQEELQLCVQRCSKEITTAGQYLESELSHFQNRLERCIVDCQDKVRDKITADTKPEEFDTTLKPKLEDCYYKCVDSNCHQLPALAKKMKTNIAANKYPHF